MPDPDDSVFNIVSVGEHARNARFSGLSLRGALPNLAKVELSTEH